MKRSQILSATKMLLAVLVSAFLTSGMAVAQNALKGTFELKEQARWDKTVLPAGSYTLAFENSSMPMRAVVRSADGKTVAIFSSSVSNDAASQQSFMLITGSGAERRVRSLNLPQLGVSLDYEPLTAAEREELSKKSVTVPVTIAAR